MKARWDCSTTPSGSTSSSSAAGVRMPRRSRARSRRHWARRSVPSSPAPAPAAAAEPEARSRTPRPRTPPAARARSPSRPEPEPEPEPEPRTSRSTRRRSSTRRRRSSEPRSRGAARARRRSGERGRAGGDARLPPGDAGARPAVVRAEAAARLRPRPIAAHPYTLLDVFTDRPLAGNGLAVVHDADPLSDATMHAFARETRLSETSFVQTAEGGADYRHRIFMMSGEIPFAGHPSLGVAVAVARARGESRATYVQQTQPGEQAIDVELDGLRASVSMLQEPPEFGPELDPGRRARPGRPRRRRRPTPRCRARSSPPARRRSIAPRARRRRAAPRAARLRPHRAAARRARRDRRSTWPPSTPRPARRACARSCARPRWARTRRPASAVGPLAAHVAARTGVERLEVDQGVEMGRPSRLVASLDGDRVRVGGDAVILAEGTVHLLDT